MTFLIGLWKLLSSGALWVIRWVMGHDPRTVALAVIGLILAVAVVGNVLLRHELVRVRADLAQEKLARKADAAMCLANADRWQASLTQASNDLRSCTDLWDRAQADTRKMREQAERARAEGALKAAEWSRRWDARAQDCGTALKELDTLCASLSSY